MQRQEPQTATLNDILITEELLQRPPRPPNWQAQAQAMQSLARQMVSDSESLLQSLVDMALDLFSAQSAGVSLLETTPTGEEIFRTHVLAGALAQYVGGTTPRNSPCGVCLDRGTPQLYSHPDRYFTYLQAVNIPIAEALVLPLIADNQTLGTIWIMSHDSQRNFDSEDVRLMTSLADFTAAFLLNQRQTRELLAKNAQLEAEAVDRQRTEAQLREVQRRLELSVTGANLGVWTYNIVTDEFWADDRAKLMHGHAPHEVHTFAEAGVNIHPEDRDRAQAAFAQAIINSSAPLRVNRSKLQIEYRAIKPDGSVNWIASYAEIIPTGDRDEGIFYGVVQDISDRKRTETQLRESQERSRALIENLPGGAAFIVDGNLRYLLAEGEALSAAGFKSEDFVGKTIFEVLPPELTANYEQWYRQGLAGEPFEYEHNAHDRSYVSRGTPLRLPNGEVYAVLAVSYDITDRKRIEKALRVSEERLKTAQKAGNVGVWDWDAASKKTYWSETMWTLYGYESQPDKTGDEIWESSQHPEDQQRIKESIAEFLASDEIDYRSEFRIIQPNGSVRWIEVVAQLIRDEALKPVRMSGVNLDISDRKQAEAALAHSRRQFEKIAATTPDLVYVFDLIEERNIYVNAGIQQVLGYSQAQIATLGSSLIGSLIHPDDIPGVIEGNQRFRDLDDGDVYDHELRMRHASGEYRWLRCRDSVFERAADGTVTQTIGTAQDITDRKHREAALRESEARLQLIANLVPDLLWDSEPDGSTNWYNQRWLEYTGQTFEQAIGWGWINAIHPDDREGSARRYQEAVEQGMLLQQEHRIRRQDGTYRWFVVKASPLKDESGKVIKMYGAATDIHEQRVALEALRESEEKFRTLANTAPALIWYNDAQGNNRFINQHFLDFTGKRAEQIHGEGWHELVHPDDAEAYIVDYLVAVREQRSWQNRNRIRRHDGVWRWHDNYAQPLFNADGVYLGHVGVTIDNTDAIEAEVALRESEEKFRNVFETIEEGFCIIEVLFDDAGKPFDYRFLETNRWFQKQTGLDNAIGKTVREFAPTHEQYWFDIYGRVARTGESVRFENEAKAIGFVYDVYAFRVGAPGENRVAVVFHDITERRRQEKALRESEEKYRTLFNAIDEGFCIIEVLFHESGQPFDFRYIEANPAFERQSGLVGAVGKTIREFAPAHEQSWFDNYGRVARTGEPVRFENHAKQLGRSYDVYAFRIGAADDNQVAVLFSDITDRRRTEAALRESEARFRSFVTASSNMVYRISADWREMRNLEGKKVLVNTESPSDTWVEVYIPPSERSLVWATIHEAIRTKTTYELEHQVFREDGTIGWVFSRAIPMLDEQGEIIEWFGAGSDITPRKQAEAALRESEEKYRSLFNAMDEGYMLSEVIFDENDKPIDILYLEANPAAIRLAGRDFSGQRMREIDPNYEEYWYEIYGRIALTGEAVRAERYAEPHGRWFEFYAFKIGEWESRRVATVFQDITDRKRAEVTLRESEERLRDILNSMSEGFALLGSDFTILDVNEETLRLDSRSRDELIGRSHWDAFPGTEDSPVGEIFRRVVRERTSASLEHAYHWPDGRSLWIDMRAYPTQNDGVAIFWRDITDRKQAEAALRESEAKYRSLFDSIDEGFALAEVIDDPSGQPIDILYLEANPAASRMTGVPDYTRRRMSEISPDFEPYWVEIYARVARSGISERNEQYAAPLNRWYDFYVFPIETIAESSQSRRVAMVFQDITDRKRSEVILRENEARQAFLLKLSDALRPLVYAREIKAAAAVAVSEWLDIASAGYAEMETGGLTAVITDEYNDGRIPSLTARYTMKDFGSVTEAMQRGEMIHFADLDEDGVSPDAQASFASINVRAAVAAPLIKNGVMVAYLFVAHPRPRVWTTADLEILGEVADRTWAAVERAKAEAALRHADERYRTMTDNVPVLIWETDESGLIFSNRHYTDFFGVSFEEVREMGWAKFLHPDDIEGYSAAYQKAFERRESYSYECRFRRADGEYRWLLNTGHPLNENRFVGFSADITENKRTEAALRESEAKYRSLFDSIDAGFCIFEMIYNDTGEAIDFRYIKTNPAFERQSGRRPQPGQTMRELFPEAEDMWLKDYAEVARTGQAKRFIDYHKDLDRWFDVFVFPTSNGKNQLAALFSDVTDEKRSESALRESEERLQKAISIETVGVLFFTLDGRITDANDTFLRLSGYSRDELRSIADWRELTPPEFWDATSVAAEELATLGTTAPYEKQYLRKDGSRWWGLFSPTRLKGNGRNAECVEFVIDITDRKYAESALRESEEKYRSLFESINDAFALLEVLYDDDDKPVDCRLLEVSPSFEVETGLPQAQGKTLKELIPSIEPDWFECYHQVLVTNDRGHIEMRQEYLKTWFEVDALPYGNPQDRQVIIVFRNINDRKQAEAERLQLIREQSAREQERQRAESLAELDRAKTLFFSNVSHEFRTPLTLLLAPLQDALSDSVNPVTQAQRERLELAHRNSLRLLKLVNILLDFSRIEAGRMEAVYEPTDLAQFTTELASVFRSAIERAGLRLVVDCPPLAEPVYVDREMWEKIVLNLLSNAFKFTLEGEIAVRLYLADDHHVTLQVEDTGTGIELEELPHLMKRFYQVRGTKEKQGLMKGLVLVLLWCRN